MSLTENLNNKNRFAKNVYEQDFCPLVHILLPVYNHKKYLSSSIESVLNQDYKNLTLLILNDGSTEDLSLILEKHKADQRIRIFQEENVGLPKALTKLYSYSLSETDKPSFITWHSADNYYEPDAISQMVTCLTQNYNIGITYANVRLIDETGNSARNSKYRKNDQLTDDNSIINLNYPFETISEFNDNFVNACFLVRANLEARIPCFLDENKGFEDYIRWLKLSLMTNGAHIGFDRPLYNYRLHRETLTEELKDSSIPEKQFAAVKKTSSLKKAFIAEDIPFKLHTTASVFNLGSKIENHLSAITKLLINLLNKGSVTVTPMLSCLDKESLKDIPTALLLTKITAPLHNSHETHFKIPPLSAKLSSGKLCSQSIFELKNWVFSGTSNLHIEIKRSRDRDLGMFDKEIEAKHFYQNRLFIFAPSSERQEVISRIKDFVKNSNKNLIIFYCASQAERKIADTLYLGCDCAPNIRIVDESFCHNSLQNKPTGLLNALGSSDAIISLSCFLDLDSACPELGLFDYISESIFSSLSKRPLIADINFIKKNETAVIAPPLLITMQENMHLPLNLSDLKLKASNLTLDSYLSQFEHEFNLTQLIATSLIEYIK